MRIKILYWLGWFLTRFLSKALFRIEISGREHVPRSGGFILAANHTSYLDPLLVGSWIRREVYFFAKRELFANSLLGPLIRRTNALPVHRGGVDRRAVQLAVDAIHHGFGLTIFPEGTRSKGQAFLQPKAGVGMIAMQAKCPIVVAYLHGVNRIKDCFWGRVRMRIVFGEPLSADWVKSFEPERDSYQQISAAVMERISELKKQATDVK